MKFICLENFDNGSKRDDGSPLSFKKGDEYKGSMEKKELDVLLSKKLIAAEAKPEKAEEPKQDAAAPEKEKKSKNK